MQVYPSRNQFENDPASALLLQALQDDQRLELAQALLYHTFPLYRDDEGGLIVADCVLLSPWHGVIIFALSSTSGHLAEEEVARCMEVAEQVPPYVYSRLVKNRQLRRSPVSLSFDIIPIIYAPLAKRVNDLEIHFATSPNELYTALDELKRQDPIDEIKFKELIATIDGAKGLIRPKKRQIVSDDESSKGKQADLVEAAITLFDQQQKHGIMGRITGPQRIRGLAGSGKTVVLAMKAALTHLQKPEARIAYTFYTKSLYQHVKRLITRFYRQFDDRDPDWDRKVHILHGWGGRETPGLYSVACDQNGVQSLTFQDAASKTGGDRFDYACKDLLRKTTINPIYDYVFVDEGQDFPLSFIRLCHALADGGKFVLAYDDLQTIFQTTTPSSAEIFGTNSEGVPLANFEDDVVLHKCYRNPREVLVSAHALGFGIYSKKIVQMLESPDHWEDIGYIVREGTFVAGSKIVIERPSQNSLPIISDRNGFDEIIHAKAFNNMDEEIAYVTTDISLNISDGLKPEDILVVTVDDRSAKEYLSGIEIKLFHKNIEANNLHSDSFGVRDFSKENRVTLSTVHKAKGNEAFMVYVVGVDAVVAYSNVRRRNMLFTAVTRAKGWVRVTGVGDSAKQCLAEIEAAKSHFPDLVFNYPAPEELKIMKRDLAEAADRRLKAQRLMDQLQEEFSDEEIAAFLKEKGARRKSSKKR